MTLSSASAIKPPSATTESKSYDLLSSNPRWASARTELCVTKSHEIVCFRTTVDTADGWAIGDDGNAAT